MVLKTHGGWVVRERQTMLDTEVRADMITLPAKMILRTVAHSVLANSETWLDPPS